MTRIPGNDPCPCGSGRKHEKCCIDNGFTRVCDSEGDSYRQLELDDEARAVLAEMEQQFISEHGRPPGPEDLVFGAEPEHIEHECVQAMKRAGVHPSLILRL
ncbi:MAG: SEC-C domain-containing protein [Armatimonadetes bacterium]|nr:SEC-C domain-containing protein [Armatimonadota bacterium]